MKMLRVARLDQYVLALAAVVTVCGSLALSACSEASSSDDGPAKQTENTDSEPPGDAGIPSIEVDFVGEGVECGEELCKDAQIVGQAYGAKGCCAEAKESSCGLDMSGLGVLLGLWDPGCEALDRPGSEDSSCPESGPIYLALPEAPPEGITLAGCCQANGECGYSADFGGVGFGCVGPDEFNQESSGSCDYEP